MVAINLFFATNRGHEGKNRARPARYGIRPSTDGGENLRFGQVTLNGLDQSRINELLEDDVGYGLGDGVGLSEYLLDVIEDRGMRIQAHVDTLNEDKPDILQASAAKKLGSIQVFNSLRDRMRETSDVLIYIHGFNVSWEEAVAAAMALQLKTSYGLDRNDDKDITVILFSWPSDGAAKPIYSYKSDRADAEYSGASFGRGLLKLRDFLQKHMTRKRDSEGRALGRLNCEHEIHLLCHSMGNYVLQNTLKRLIEFNHGMTLPRLFDHIFMCSPDVDDNVFEAGQPLQRLHELARSITVYYNRGDVAMYISDYTKQNPDRLGMNGIANPSQVSSKIHQVDCSDVVEGVVEHSYYLNGIVNADIRLSIDAIAQDSFEWRPHRIVRKNAWPNEWSLTMPGEEDPDLEDFG